MPSNPQLKERGSSKRPSNLRLLLLAAGASTLEVEEDRARGVRVVRTGQLTSLVAALLGLSIWGITWLSGAPERALQAESRDWPSAVALVTRGARWCSGGDTWVGRNVRDRSLCVDYEYPIGDEIFKKVNAPVWQHFGSPFPDSANQYVLDAFRTGAPLAIRYDPETPGDSIVKPKGPSTEGWENSLVWTGVGLAFGPWFLFTFVLFLRLRRESLAADAPPLQTSHGSP